MIGSRSSLAQRKPTRPTSRSSAGDAGAGRAAPPGGRGCAAGPARRSVGSSSSQAELAPNQTVPSIGGKRRSRRRRSAGAAALAGASVAAATPLSWPRWRRIGQGDRAARARRRRCRGRRPALPRSPRRRASRSSQPASIRSQRRHGAVEAQLDAGAGVGEPGAGEAARIDPARRPGSARRATTAATPARRLAASPIERLDVVGGQPLRIDESPASRRGRGRSRCGATRATLPRTPCRSDRRAHGSAGGEGSGAMEARVPAVAAMDDAVEEAGGVARAFARRPRRRARATSDRMPRSASARASAQPARPAPTMTTGACVRSSRLRRSRRLVRPAPPTSRGDRGRPAPWRGSRREARREAAARDVALAAAAGRDLDREAGAAQAVANGARGAPGRDRRFRRGQPRHRLEQARVPHRRVARRREAVEEEGVDVGDQLRQPGVDGAEREQQLDAAVVDGDAVQVAGERRPLARELGRQRRERRVALERREGRLASAATASIEMKWSCRQRSGSARQAAHVARKLLPRPKPVSRIDEAVSAAPARGKRVAVEEDVARLRERARARVVDVVVLGRSRRAVVVDDDPRRDDRRRLHLRAGAGAARAASQASRRSRTPSRRAVGEHGRRHAGDRVVQPERRIGARHGVGEREGCRRGS